jgi:hypothetical protein
MKVTYHMNVAGKKSFKSTCCGVKQGDNLGPILFIFMIHEDRYGSHKWNPSLGKGTNTPTEGTPFSFWKSYYINDDAFLFLNRENIKQASALIVKHFKCFGLTTVHSGDKKNNKPSKTEAMHIPQPYQQSTVEEHKGYHDQQGPLLCLLHQV